MKTSSRRHILVPALVLLGTASVFAAEGNISSNRPAEVISTVSPAYPYLMRRAEAAAEVTVRFTVNSKGMVTKASVLKSSNIDFNAVTLNAIKKWTFSPATKDGRAVDARLEQTFRFSVGDKSLVPVAPLIAEKSGR